MYIDVKVEGVSPVEAGLSGHALAQVEGAEGLAAGGVGVPHAGQVHGATREGDLQTVCR